MCWCQAGITKEDQLLIFDKSPEWLWFQMMNKGLDRPFPESNLKKLHVKLIVDYDIFVLVVNGISLIARGYQKFGDDLAVVAANGKVEFKNIVLRK
ncbi:MULTISPECIES: hypothetical protein [unclassified Lactobacillus]|uniref:hypothetical protein n=1 Tax=unclassified Lactobacillus TaxID=2620435 RepID=UPI000EFBC51D|nr:MULTISPECIES: hypothetical protein [unclassified Lactobacillus]RMC24624.1 hypothetical protein F5ESL0247_03775 [Lactobacillus sp. ESL0247]RMC28896.1 hypothetical protein F5ESL0246_03775 [Lactobacillus sp. ESL0246]RMC32141.1 hypothetical protein F5ESL0245_03780 [Lactobacillus sp. ESL0245]